MQGEKMMRSVFEEGGHLYIGGEVGATVEGGELDDEVDVDLFWMHALHKFVGCSHGAAGSEEVVVNHYDVVLVDGIAVHLDGVDAILFGVGFLDCDSGEFAGLTGRHEAATEFVGEDRAADKTAGFDADYLGDTLVAVEVGEGVAGDTECLTIFQHRGEVAKHDSLAVEIRHIAD